MIPTLMVAGFLVGRWWAVPVAAVAWPALLLVAGGIGVESVPGAAAFAALNVAVGVLPRWVLRELSRVARALRARPS